VPDKRWAVIDTNVLIAANRKSSQANGACVENCIDFLFEVREAGSLVLDETGDIFEEYSSSGYLNYSGRPGSGDEFFVWVYENQHTKCHRVPLTPHEDRVYEEFPDTPALATFDRSDRKWIATALGCTPTATIYNAVDSDYAQHAQALADAAIPVTELCPDCIKPEHRPK
jgi:hypothetical protein